jgi:hypothetical protein
MSAETHQMYPKSADQLRAKIEGIFYHLHELLGSNIKSNAYGALAQKQQAYSGQSYLDQLEKNVVYLNVLAIRLGAAAAKYLCTGEPLLRQQEISDYVQSTCVTPALLEMPFHTQVRPVLEHATFAHPRQLVELLIDRVVVTENNVEIRYVIPTQPDGPHVPFCHLRTNYQHRTSRRIFLVSPAFSPPLLNSMSTKPGEGRSNFTINNQCELCLTLCPQNRGRVGPPVRMTGATRVVLTSRETCRILWRERRDHSNSPR